MMMRVQNVTSSSLVPLPLLPVAFKNSSYYNNNSPPENPNLITCGSSGRPPGWVSGAGKSDGAQRFSLNFDDDDERGSRKRVWWSNDFEDEDDDDDDDGGLGFGVLEDSFHASSLIFKVLNAFGWMVPAVAISMLLGTGGTNTFLMALVLPLAQSAVSFIADTFLGSSVGPKPRRKRAKRKPFYRARSSTEMRQDVNTHEVDENYQFREATKSKPRDKRVSSFGGWDELDKGLGSFKVPKREPASKTNELQSKNSSKLSRRMRSRGTPLLVRLLIAVFPFLGSWTRLF